MGLFNLMSGFFAVMAESTQDERTERRKKNAVSAYTLCLAGEILTHNYGISEKEAMGAAIRLVEKFNEISEEK